MTPLGWFLVAAGVFAGAAIGVVAMAVVTAAKNADNATYAAWRDEFTGRLD